MNAHNYEPINVLNLFKGFNASYTTHSIIPYRFERKDGRTYSIAEIRIVNKIRSGGKDQFHFDVKTKKGSTAGCYLIRIPLPGGWLRSGKGYEG